jgi:hypothetical protein
MGRECRLLERDEKCIHYFGWKTWRELTTWKTRHRWEDSIRMEVKEIGWEGVDWMHLAQDRDWWWAVVTAGMNLQVLYRVGIVSWLSNYMKCNDCLQHYIYAIRKFFFVLSFWIWSGHSSITAENWNMHLCNIFISKWPSTPLEYWYWISGLSVC